MTLDPDNNINNNGGAPPSLRIPPRNFSTWEVIFLGPQGEPRPGWRAALYVSLFALFLLFAAGLYALARRLMPGISSGFTPGNLLQQELLLFACAAAAAAVMSRIEGRPFGDYGLPLRLALGARFWQGALWGTAQISLLILLIAGLHGYSFGGLALAGGELLRYALLWAAVFLLVGLFEEFFFRGYLQFTLTTGLRFWLAATFTSLAFGAVHLGNVGEGPWGIASVFLIGMFLCLTLRRTGNLWFAVGWHAAFDFGETYLYSVPNSGIVMPGHLLGASLHGPRWLTGGSIGPEGSALAFAVSAVAFVVFDRLYRPRGKSLQ